MFLFFSKTIQQLESKQTICALTHTLHYLTINIKGKFDAVSHRSNNQLIGPWGIWLQSQISKFQTHFNDKYLKYFLWNCYQVNATQYLTDH